MEKQEKKLTNKCNCAPAGAGAVYGLGLIGSFVYYIQNSTTFMEGFIGFLKALVWPAFLIHKIYTILGM